MLVREGYPPTDPTSHRVVYTFKPRDLMKAKWDEAQSDRKSLILLFLAKADAKVRDHDGKLPWHLAAENNDSWPLQLLLEHAKLQDAPDRFGETPLYCALGHSAKNSVDGAVMIALLLKAGSATRVKDSGGRTARELAMRSENKLALDLIDAAEHPLNYEP